MNARLTWMGFFSGDIADVCKEMLDEQLWAEAIYVDIREEHISNFIGVHST